MKTIYTLIWDDGETTIPIGYVTEKLYLLNWPSSHH